MQKKKRLLTSSLVVALSTSPYSAFLSLIVCSLLEFSDLPDSVVSLILFSALIPALKIASLVKERKVPVIDQWIGKITFVTLALFALPLHNELGETSQTLLLFYIMFFAVILGSWLLLKKGGKR